METDPSSVEIFSRLIVMWKEIARSAARDVKC